MPGQVRGPKGYTLECTIMLLGSVAALVFGGISLARGDTFGAFLLPLGAVGLVVGIGLWLRQGWAIWTAFVLFLLGFVGGIVYTATHPFKLRNVIKVLVAGAGAYAFGEARPRTRAALVSPTRRTSSGLIVAMAVDADDNGEVAPEAEEPPDLTLDNIGLVIAAVEQDLRQIAPPTPFHALLGRSFLGQVDEAAQWLAASYEKAATQGPVAFVYVEMNGFTINWDRWYADAFMFESEGEAMEDLGMFDQESDAPLVLVSMEDMQKAFEAFHQAEDRSPLLLDAWGAAGTLVTLHLQHLMLAAHQKTRANGHPVGNVPLWVNSHDSTLSNATSRQS